MIVVSELIEQGLTRIFLDTAPVIYYVERNPSYFESARSIFEQIDAGILTAVTSPITLAECLIYPYRQNSEKLQQDFSAVIVGAKHTVFQPIDAQVGRKAAILRADYNLSLADALQVSAALSAKCDVFLTNDKMLQRINELRVCLIEDIASQDETESCE